jgi:hypothetical protein
MKKFMNEYSEVGGRRHFFDQLSLQHSAFYLSSPARECVEPLEVTIEEWNGDGAIRIPDAAFKSSVLMSGTRFF